MLSNLYNPLPPFKFWCQTVLPAVYDESLSYYELLNKVIDYLNKLNENMDEAFKAISDYLIGVQSELQQYIDKTIADIDFVAIVEQTLDEMVESGQLNELLTPIIENIAPDLVSDWLDEHIEIPGQVVLLDDTLSVEGAAADARKVGQILFNNLFGENRNGLTPKVVSHIAVEGSLDLRNLPRESKVYKKKSELSQLPSEASDVDADSYFACLRTGLTLYGNVSVFLLLHVATKKTWIGTWTEPGDEIPLANISWSKVVDPNADLLQNFLTSFSHPVSIDALMTEGVYTSALDSSNNKYITGFPFRTGSLIVYKQQNNRFFQVAVPNGMYSINFPKIRVRKSAGSTTGRVGDKTVSYENYEYTHLFVSEACEAGASVIPLFNAPLQKNAIKNMVIAFNGVGEDVPHFYNVASNEVDSITISNEGGLVEAISEDTWISVYQTTDSLVGKKIVFGNPEYKDRINKGVYTIKSNQNNSIELETPLIANLTNNDTIENAEPVYETPLVRFYNGTQWSEFTPIFNINAVNMDTLDEDVQKEDWLRTEFEQIAGWWSVTGTLDESSSSRKHSQFIPVKPGQTLYGMYWGGTIAGTVGGIFADSGKNFLAPIKFPYGQSPDPNYASEYVYEQADVKIDAAETYSKMYKIIVPENAAFISINLRYSNAYLSTVQSLSTLPIIGRSNTGDTVWRRGDPFVQRKRGKKLYIIGQSGVGRDRSAQSDYNAATGSTNGSHPSVGFQEYIIPYYGVDENGKSNVVSLGFSGVGYRWDREHPSVYYYLTTPYYEYTHLFVSEACEAGASVIPLFNAPLQKNAIKNMVIAFNGVGEDVPHFYNVASNEVDSITISNEGGLVEAISEDTWISVYQTTDSLVGKKIVFGNPEYKDRINKGVYTIKSNQNNSIELETPLIANLTNNDTIENAEPVYETPLVRFYNGTQWSEFTPIFNINAVNMDTLDEDVQKEDWLRTEFEQIAGWWSVTGTLDESSSSRKHSQFIPVKPGQTLYGMYWGGTIAGTVGGIFADSGKNFLAPIKFPYGQSPDPNYASEYVYEQADVKIDAAETYSKMYKIIVPENAAFISINLRYSNAYLSTVQSLSTLPIIGRSNTGDTVWRRGDPFVQRKRGKKLYIIGQSGVGRDRSAQSDYNAATGSTNGSHPSVGFQEYIIPYYGVDENGKSNVVSLGFSGVGYRWDREHPSVYYYLTTPYYDMPEISTTSAYSEGATTVNITGTTLPAQNSLNGLFICFGNKETVYEVASNTTTSITLVGALADDIENGTRVYYAANYRYKSEDTLKDADEILICAGSNNLNSLAELGNYKSTDPETLLGAVNGIIDFIYTNSTKKKLTIYIETMPNKYLDGANPQAGLLFKNYNEQLRKLCEYRGLILIDREKTMGLNANNFRYFSCDSNTASPPYGTHMNDLGNKLRADCYLNALVFGGNTEPGHGEYNVSPYSAVVTGENIPLFSLLDMNDGECVYVNTNAIKEFQTEGDMDDKPANLTGYAFVEKSQMLPGRSRENDVNSAIYTFTTHNGKWYCWRTTTIADSVPTSVNEWHTIVDDTPPVNP